MAEHFRHIAEPFFVLENGRPALEGKVPERAVTMKGVGSRA
jgi:hypothetical protein